MSDQANTTTTPAPPPGLPDLNSGQYPFNLVLDLLTQGTADFVFLAVPTAGDSKLSDTADPYTLNGGFVLNISSGLHRLNSVVQEPSASAGVRVAQVVGESEGRFTTRLTIAPDDFPWSLGKEPTPVLFDPLRPQRFVNLDNVFSFGSGADSFSGYAVGRTFPTTVQGKPALLVGAMGNILNGRGKLQGLEGTYALNGTITPGFGFQGAITLRIVDWSGSLRPSAPIPAITAVADPEATYIVMQGQKKDPTVQSAYSFSPSGQLQGITTPAVFRSASYSFSTAGPSGLRSQVAATQAVASLDAVILTNLATPATPTAPAPFGTQETYTFFDHQENVVGTIKTGVVEGYSFNLVFPSAPGQPGLRFAGYGPITGGTGAFAGVQGMLTVNSLIGISPHAIWLVHVLRILNT